MREAQALLPFLDPPQQPHLRKHVAEQASKKQNEKWIRAVYSCDEDKDNQGDRGQNPHALDGETSLRNCDSPLSSS